MQTPTPFTHTPRPAIADESGPYAWQRRYAPSLKTLDYQLEPANTEARQMCAHADVFRNAENDAAQLRIKLGISTYAQAVIELSPDEMRELARRLIDAAHDIEANPAAVLASEAAKHSEVAA